LDYGIIDVNSLWRLLPKILSDPEFDHAVLLSLTVAIDRPPGAHQHALGGRALQVASQIVGDPGSVFLRCI
jgi:hypothetical protein